MPLGQGTPWRSVLQLPTALSPAKSRVRRRDPIMLYSTCICGKRQRNSLLLLISLKIPSRAPYSVNCWSHVTLICFSNDRMVWMRSHDNNVFNTVQQHSRLKGQQYASATRSIVSAVFLYMSVYILSLMILSLWALRTGKTSWIMYRNAWIEKSACLFLWLFQTWSLFCYRVFFVQRYADSVLFMVWPAFVLVFRLHYNVTCMHC